MRNVRPMPVRMRESPSLGYISEMTSVDCLSQGRALSGWFDLIAPLMRPDEGNADMDQWGRKDLGLWQDAPCEAAPKPRRAHGSMRSGRLARPSGPRRLAHGSPRSALLPGRASTATGVGHAST